MTVNKELERSSKRSGEWKTSKHAKLDEHCTLHAPEAVTVGLITACWVSLNVNQLSLAARSLQGRTLSICSYTPFVNCLGARNARHVCECLTTWSLWENISSSLASPPVFAGFVLWFRHISISGQRCLWRASCEKIKDVPSNAVGSTGCGLKLGPRQSWAAFDGLIMFYEFNAETRTWNDEHLWLHGVSLYFSMGSGLSLASGWNLCCAAISCMTSHRSFLFVVDCYVELFNSLVFQCDDMVSKCRDMTSRSKPWFEVATQVALFPTEEQSTTPKGDRYFQVVLEYSFHDCSAMAPWSPARHIGSCFDSFAFTVLCCSQVSPGMKLP